MDNISRVSIPCIVLGLLLTAACTQNNPLESNPHQFKDTDLQSALQKNDPLKKEKDKRIIFYNELGSTTEISNSVDGPNGLITGQVGFAPCQFGNGLTDVTYQVNEVSFPGALPADTLQGRITFWWIPRYDSADYLHHSIFNMTAVGYPDLPNNQEFYLAKVGSDPGFDNWLAAVVFNGSEWLADYRWQVNFTAGTLMSVDLRWDLTADIGAKFALFIDGIEYPAVVYQSRDTATINFPACDLGFTMPGITFNSIVDDFKIRDRMDK